MTPSEREDLIIALSERQDSIGELARDFADMTHEVDNIKELTPSKEFLGQISKYIENILAKTNIANVHSNPKDILEAVMTFALQLASNRLDELDIMAQEQEQEADWEETAL